jgi:hypothetical protein
MRCTGVRLPATETLPWPRFARPSGTLSRGHDNVGVPDRLSSRDLISVRTQARPADGVFSS